MEETVSMEEPPQGLSETSLLLGVGDEVWLGIACALVLFLIAYYLFIPDSPVGSPTTDVPQTARRTPDAESSCPVCLDNLKFAVETNCGHVYCGECIFSVVELGDRGLLETPTCPYCRQRMTMMLPYFSESEISDDSDITTAETRNQVLAQVKRYNRFYSGQPRSFSEHLADLPMISRRMMRYLTTQDGITFLMNARIVPYLIMTAVYALSPFDIVPESLFGMIGVLDDLIILVMCVLYMVTIYRNFAAENLTNHQHA